MAAKKDEKDAPEETKGKSDEKDAKKDAKKEDDEPVAATTGTAVPPAPPTGTAPVVMNNYTVRSDDDAMEGGWVDIVSGDYAGRFGSFRQALEHDPKTGYPTLIAVRTRDAENELLAVDYGDVRPSARTGGR